MQPEQIEGAGPHLFPRCHSAPAPLVQGGGAETPGPPGPTRSIPSLVAENAGVWGRSPHPGLEELSQMPTAWKPPTTQRLGVLGQAWEFPVVSWVTV